MRLRMITSEILSREARHLMSRSQHQIDLDLLPSGLGEGTQAAFDLLQRKVDQFEPDGHEAILLGCCLSNPLLERLTTSHTLVVIPRVYDVADLFLGSRERRKVAFEEDPGTFHFTYGRVEAWEASKEDMAWTASYRLLRYKAYQDLVRQYGEDNARVIFETMRDWSNSYYSGQFVNLGLEGDDEARSKTQQICHKNRWSFTEIEGDLNLLQRWLSGEWDPKEFLTLEPGQQIVETLDDRIYEAKTSHSISRLVLSQVAMAPVQSSPVAVAVPTPEQTASATPGAHGASAGQHAPQAEQRGQPKERRPPRAEGEVDTSLNLDDLLRTLVERGGSDLHIKAGQPPIIRVHGQLHRLDHKPMTSATTKALMYSIMNEERIQRYEEELEMDLAYHIPGVARFRVNVLRQRFCVGGVMRQIPIDIKTIDERKLPPVLKDLSMRPRGLILVTGPTGSGKSTTLASCIDHINLHRRAHIITIEDPIEFVHNDKKCIVEQRELGQDTHSFADALKHVMRQAPDVILVGEMRDLETIALAITAAETGHLVFGTLHTTDAAQTIDRIIDVFPPEQQEQIRAQLAITLEAVISQTLMPLKGEPGRIAAFEIMVCTPAIRALIREAKTHQMYSIIQSSADLGMISLDQFLLNLLQEGKIEWDIAVSKTSNVADFKERAKRLGLMPAEVPTGGDQSEVQDG